MIGSRMKSHDVAIRLLRRFHVDESLVGDLVELRRSGRSPLWFWRQTVNALAAHVATDVRSDPSVVVVTATVVAGALALPYVWTHWLGHYANVLHAAWYPRAFNWFTRSSPHALWQVVVFLHPWEWDFDILWSAMLYVVTWGLIRTWPHRAHVIVLIFVLSNVSQSLPSLGRSVFDWSRAPFNPVWTSNLIWYGFFELVVIPASIIFGARRASRVVVGG